MSRTTQPPVPLPYLPYPELNNARLDASVACLLVGCAARAVGLAIKDRRSPRSSFSACSRHYPFSSQRSMLSPLRLMLSDRFAQGVKVVQCCDEGLQRWQVIWERVSTGPR
jgi:hypothetical protein